MNRESGISIFSPTLSELSQLGIEFKQSADERLLWLGTPQSVAFFASSTSATMLATAAFSLTVGVMSLSAVVERYNQGQPSQLIVGLFVLALVLVWPVLLFVAIQSIKRQLTYVITNNRILIFVGVRGKVKGPAKFIKSVREMEPSLPWMDAFRKIRLDAIEKLWVHPTVFGSGNLVFQLYQSADREVPQKLPPQAKSVFVRQPINLAIVRWLNDIFTPRFDNKLVGVPNLIKVASLIEQQV